MKFMRALPVLTALCAWTALNATAEPRGSSNQGRDYLVGDSDNAGWYCGAFYQGREREVSVAGVAGTLDETRAAIYVGHPLTPWISLCAIAGTYDGTFSNLSEEDDQSFLYGGAANFDLFNHEVQDPLLMENEIRINANVTYYGAQADILGDTRQLQDLVAALTVSIVNDVFNGSFLYWPEAIAIFGGPVYAASISGDVDDEEDKVGATVGLEVFQTKHITYFVRADVFENTGFAGGLNLRF